MASTYILRNTRYSPSLGHGGNRRTFQISEILKREGIDCVDCFSDATKGKKEAKEKIGRYLNAFSTIIKHRIVITPSRHKLGSLGLQRQLFNETLNDYNEATLLLLEASNNYAVYYFAKEYGLKIVAAPHNLESLVIDSVDPFTDRKLPYSFENELEYYRQVDALFCISREEQWLLRNRGINAEYLPYYPPTSIANELVNVREKRAKIQQRRLLILGTAFNPPTLEGMKEQLAWLQRISKQSDFEVDIVGYGTEKLEGLINHPKFMLHGAVDSISLVNFLVNAKAILVHQKTGLGSLTRIPEMLVAGIPVIANTQAARSAYDYDGVHCYESETELASLINLSLPTPSLLSPPKAAERRFLSCIRNLI